MSSRVRLRLDRPAGARPNEAVDRLGTIARKRKYGEPEKLAVEDVLVVRAQPDARDVVAGREQWRQLEPDPVALWRSGDRPADVREILVDDTGATGIEQIDGGIERHEVPESRERELERQRLVTPRC